MKILAVKIAPYSFPEVIEINDNLEDLRKEVGKNFDFRLMKSLAIVCDKNKIQLNRGITERGEIYDKIEGTYLITGRNESLVSLTNGQLRKLFRSFCHHGQYMKLLNGRMICLPHYD